MKHHAWCDSLIQDVHLLCNCREVDHTQLDIELRRDERERCARVVDVFAQDAQYEYSNYEIQMAVAGMARRIARDLRLMED